MSSVKNIIAVLGFMLIALCGVLKASVYKVGDDAGWASGKVNYMKWASAKTFHVGDVVVFDYDKQSQNVLQVTRESFHSCNAANPIATYATGNDTIHIKNTGHFFYICGLPGHCQAGQKVDIRVAGEAPSKPRPSPSPAVSPSHVHMAPAPGPTGSAPAVRSAIGAAGLVVLAIFIIA